MFGLWNNPPTLIFKIRIRITNYSTLYKWMAVQQSNKMKKKKIKTKLLTKKNHKNPISTYKCSRYYCNEFIEKNAIKKVKILNFFNLNKVFEEVFTTYQ